jgi:hypothetical protein
MEQEEAGSHKRSSGWFTITEVGGFASVQSLVESEIGMFVLALLQDGGTRGCPVSSRIDARAGTVAQERV